MEEASVSVSYRLFDTLEPLEDRSNRTTSFAAKPFVRGSMYTALMEL